MSKLSPFAGTLGFSGGSMADIIRSMPLISGALAQPSSEEILKNATNPNEIEQVNEQIYQQQVQNIPPLTLNDITGLQPIQEESKEEEIPESQANMFPGEATAMGIPITEQSVGIPTPENSEITEFQASLSGSDISNEDANEMQRLIQDVGVQVNEEIPVEHREQFREWLTRIIAETLQGQHTDKLRIISDIATQLLLFYELYKEKKQFSDIQQPSSEESPELYNDKKIKEWQETTMPSQCRRLPPYVDSAGKLRSVVICESMGQQRIYHQ